MVANPQYATEYGDSFKKSQETGECIFCKEFERGTFDALLYRNGGWWAKVNPFPPKGRDHQTPAERALLLIPGRHVSDVHQLGPDDWAQMGTLLHYVCQKQGITGGALCVRFGDPLLSGRTLLHLHFQLIVPGTGRHEGPLVAERRIDPIPFWVG